MKRKWFFLGLCLQLVGSMVFSSCMKNNGETIALIGTEYYIDDISSIIPDSLQHLFDSLFEDIPIGSVPPSIAIPDSIKETDSVDSYVVHPNLLVKTNLYSLSSTVVWPDVYMRFSEQHNGIAVMELYEESLQKTDTVFVMGNNNDFTIYCIEDKNDENVKRGVIMCGTWTELGLSNLRMAFIVLEAGDQAFNPGIYYFFKDGDGLAERCAWPWPDNS